MAVILNSLLAALPRKSYLRMLPGLELAPDRPGVGGRIYIGIHRRF